MELMENDMLHFENDMLDLFERNKITVDGAKTVLYEDELIEEPEGRDTIISNIEQQKELLLENILGQK
jgi:DNA-binding GntR family transcriptional regulator